MRISDVHDIPASCGTRSSTSSRSTRTSKRRRSRRTGTATAPTPSASSPKRELAHLPDGRSSARSRRTAIRVRRGVRDPAGHGESRSWARAGGPGGQVVLTPHNVHVEGAFAVVVSATVAGTVEEPGDELSLSVDASERGACSRRYATPGSRAPRELRLERPALAVMPLDWGVHRGGSSAAGLGAEPVVVVSPARDLHRQTTAADGARRSVRWHDGDRRQRTRACPDRTGRSAIPAAAEYDGRVELVRENRLADVAPGADRRGRQGGQLVAVAMLHGALGEAFEVEPPYECPTYFGMLAAPPPPAGAAEERGGRRRIGRAWRADGRSGRFGHASPRA